MVYRHLLPSRVVVRVRPTGRLVEGAALVVGLCAAHLAAQTVPVDPVLPDAPGSRETMTMQQTPRRVYRGSEGVDISLGSFAQLVSSRNPGSTVVNGPYLDITQQSQSATPAAGVLATIHQSFGPLLGYNVNFGYARFTENYTSGASRSLNSSPYTPIYTSFTRGSIGTNAYELTGSYVVHGPRGRSRFVPFAQLGGGFLVFLPTPSTEPVSYVYRGTGIAGAGVNFRLSDHLSLRAEERALYFKSPGFRYGGGSSVNTNPPIPVTERYTVAQQPTFSIVYTLGHRHHLQ